MEQLKNHTVKSYDNDIKSISNTINDILILTFTSIDMVKESMVDHDKDIIERIKKHDYKINHLDGLIEKKVTSMLALRQPMAFDLRYVVSALRVAANLERIGDQAKSIIKKIFCFDRHMIDEKTKKSLFTMLEIAQIMVKDAVEAFNTYDLKKAATVLKRDDEIDEIYENFFDLPNQENFSQAQVRMMINVLLIAKSFERLADHATNIAEIANYVVSGEIVDVADQ